MGAETVEEYYERCRRGGVEEVRRETRGVDDGDGKVDDKVRRPALVDERLIAGRKARGFKSQVSQEENE